MAEKSDFEIGSIYSFTTHAPSLLGNFSNVSVDGIGDHVVARGLIDPAALHTQVYSSLPDDVEDDYRSYYYILVTRTNGNRTAVGLPWIESSSIERVDKRKIVATVENVGTDDVERIRKILRANNYDVADVEIEQTS